MHCLAGAALGTFEFVVLVAAWRTQKWVSRPCEGEKWSLAVRSAGGAETLSLEDLSVCAHSKDRGGRVKGTLAPWGACQVVGWAVEDVAYKWNRFLNRIVSGG